MIQKVKELMAISGELHIVKNNAQYAATSISEMKEELKSFKQSFTEQNELLQNNNEQMQRQLEGIGQLRSEFEKELFDFKMLKAQLQKKMLDKFEQELSNELRLQSDVLKQDASHYDDLKKGLSDLGKKLFLMQQEIDKFIDISSNIKRSDFELKTFARQLIEMDKEKLELMRKIDTLERLVSKIRRQEFTMR